VAPPIRRIKAKSSQDAVVYEFVAYVLSTDAMNFLSLYFAKIVVKTFPKETGFTTKNGSGIPILELT